MKRRISIILFSLLPVAVFAIGIPTENKELIRNITITGILIVILSLTVVSISVGLMSKIIDLVANRKVKIKKKKKQNVVQIEDSDEHIIAIAMALHLELRSLHEEEKAILTLRKMIKPFSAWNNKSYGMRNV